MIRVNPLVSIITVVFNGADTIKQTIESVINQTYNNIEYIIIDGNSTDGTQEIVEMYKDNVACFVSEEDEGIYDAMNKGIQYATGDIIGIINSDDWYEKDAVEKVVKYFRDNKTDLVYGKINEVTKEGIKKEYPVIPIRTIWYQMAVPHPSVFVKKKIYEIYGGFNLKYRLSADYELMLRFYSNHVEFGFIDAIIACFRQGGISQIQWEQGRRESCDISFKYIDKCVCKEEVVPILESIKTTILFEDMLKNNPYILKRMLEAYFKTDLKEIVIFGTGIWAKKCYDALKNTDLQVVFFLDNYREKNQTFGGKTIRNPNEIKKLDYYILIAVKNNVQEIENQLCLMRHENFVNINQMLNMYVSEMDKGKYDK